MKKLLAGYATRAPSREDAEAVVALIVACQLADTGEANMSLEELIDDWHGLDLAEEAVVVAAPDGSPATQTWSTAPTLRSRSTATSTRTTGSEGSARSSSTGANAGRATA